MTLLLLNIYDPLTHHPVIGILLSPALRCPRFPYSGRRQTYQDNAGWQGSTNERHSYLFKSNTPFMIAPTGYWEVDKDRLLGEPCDPGLMGELIRLCKENNIDIIYDFGCGAGKYVKQFVKGRIVAFGYDGNPITEEFDHCQVLDLSSNFNLPPVDLILSLEVGEHIPKEYEQTFINNLFKSTDKYLILSWAIPGQGGYGHVNEKTNEEVIELIPMNFNVELTKKFRDSVTEVPWFKNTLMVFEK